MTSTESRAQAAAVQGDGRAAGAGATFAVVFLLYMLNYMDRNVMSAVAEYVKRDLSLTDGQLGAAGSVFLACVAGFALPAAFLADRWSRKRAIAAMAIVWSAATALTGLAGGLFSLLAARALVGVGEAGFASGGTAMLSSAWPAARRGRILGLWNASIPLGGAIGTVVGAMLARRTGHWSTPFFAFAVPGAALAIAALSLREPESGGNRAAGTGTGAFLASVKGLLGVRSLRLVYAGYAANMFITTAMLFWIPSYFARTYSLPLDAAGRRAAIPLMLALVGAPIGGMIADRWAERNPGGRALACAVFSVVAALLLGLALLAGGGTVSLALIFAWGLLAPAFAAPAGAITQDVVRPELRATSYGGCVLAMYLLGGAWSPIIVGAISDRVGDIGRAMLILPFAGVIAGGLFHRAARYYAADRAAVAH